MGCLVSKEKPPNNYDFWGQAISHKKTVSPREVLLTALGFI
jgi:hypothetical protein